MMKAAHNINTQKQISSMGEAMGTKRKIVVEVDDEGLIPKILGELNRIGVKAYVEPDPERVKERILARWKRLGRRARPGELKGISLEEEFG
jgi:hypothetical protein